MELEVGHSKKLEVLETELMRLDFARANERVGELAKALVAHGTKLEKAPANESEAALVEEHEREPEKGIGWVFASWLATEPVLMHIKDLEAAPAVAQAPA